MSADKSINDYHIDYDRCIGKGAYSRVYIGVAKDKKLITDNDEGLVAVKVIHRKMVTEKVLPRLEKEIQIMKLIQNMSHPNLVKCYDVFETHDVIYFILEFCESGDLSRMLKRPMKEKYVQFYICQVVSGLQFLIDNGIYHHDIKPRNILLTMNKKIVKIADFGFSTLSSDKDRSLSLCGSPLYMAPEIMNRIDGDKTKTDIWSVGMLMYEMLFNKHPFSQSDTLTELIEMMNTHDIQVPPEGSINRGISEDCLSLLKHILQKDHRHRISWTNLCYHPWTNKYWIEQDHNEEYIVHYQKETQDMPLSFISVQSDDVVPISKLETSTPWEDVETNKSTVSRASSMPIPIKKQDNRW